MAHAAMAEISASCLANATSSDHEARPSLQACLVLDISARARETTPMKSAQPTSFQRSPYLSLHMPSA
eukprot:CAMPEP_0183427216 /NCGR_PEP_ID=MMETSP0370-20130417/40633_1 /TAXON_ID=268820 /ORGANISM="Peridinium aciculiferum, Strain PAER-2" /LENGTH=67 /DNA_ID=CAMNT_0025611751 /DNA_START=23 /DNA_END=222 /DNA_ORIENTATION=-